jgi:hypothetical protein
MTGHLRKQSLASNANSSSSAFVLSKSSMTATHGTEKGVVIRNQDPKTAEGQHPIHSCNEKSTSVTMIVTSLFSFMSKYEYEQFGYKSKSISSNQILCPKQSVHFDIKFKVQTILARRNLCPKQSAV